MQNFRKLEAWQKSHAMVLRTYAITATFPKSELFGLTSQMRRAAVSIPANISEGCYLGQRGQANSLRIALGSAGELEHYIILASDLKLLVPSDQMELSKEISDLKALVTGFLKVVNASIESAAKSKPQTANSKR